MVEGSRISVFIVRILTAIAVNQSSALFYVPLFNKKEENHKITRSQIYFKDHRIVNDRGFFTVCIPNARNPNLFSEKRQYFFKK